VKAYLDIETDRNGNLCVFGAFIEQNGFVQLHGPAITSQSVAEIMDGVDTIVTFNGDLFDIPFIKKHLDIDLRSNHRSLDLFKIKKKLGIKGGLKELEKMYGIARKTEGVNGYKAVLLWEMYTKKGRIDALDLLLEYNKEDVINLISLEEILFSQLDGASYDQTIPNSINP
jgi:uncharacterized protein